MLRRLSRPRSVMDLGTFVYDSLTSGSKRRFSVYKKKSKNIHYGNNHSNPTH